jgi:hypothetical protein
MSELTEVAEREAAEAEAEEPEQDETAEEEAAEEEPPVEPEPAVERLTPEQAEAIVKSLEREAQRHAREVEKRAGPMFADLTPCPLCVTAGFAFKFVGQPIDPAQAEAVHALLGETAPTEYAQDPDTERCDTCNGWGEVLSGAQADRSKVIQCNRCGGKGYRQKIQQYAPPIPLVTPPFPGAEIPHTPLPQGSKDGWGRPAGHPHWGVDPASIGATG